MPIDDVSLKEYIESRLSAVAHESLVAKEDLERRLESMNEFRSQLTSQAGTFLRVDEYARRHDDLLKRTSALELSRANAEGRFWSIGVGVTIINILIGLLIKFIKGF